MPVTTKTTRGGTAAASSTSKVARAARKVTGEVLAVGDLVYPSNGEENIKFLLRTSADHKVTLMAAGFVALGVRSIVCQGDNVEVQIDQSKSTAGKPSVCYVKNIPTGEEVSTSDAAEVDAVEEAEARHNK